MANLQAGVLPAVESLDPGEHRELRRALAAPDRFGRRTIDLLSRFLLVEVVNSALRSLSLDELLGRLLALAVGTLDAERGTILLHDPVRDEFFARIVQGGKVDEIRIPRGTGIAGWVFDTDQAEIVDEAYADPRFNPEVDQRTGYRTRSVVCVPLHDQRGTAIGTVEILNKREGFFDAVDLGLLRAIAAQASTALEHARTYEDERRERQQDQKLIEVTEAITVELDLDRLLERIAEESAHLLDAERATLFLHDPASNELVSRATAGGAVSELRIPSTRGIAGACFTGGVALNVPDAYADPRFDPTVDARTGYRTRSLLCVPLTDQPGRPPGVLEVINKRSGAFVPGDERRLRSFAAQAAIAVQNAQLFTDVMALKSYTDSILRSLSDGVVTLDRDLNIVKINEAARRLLRIPHGVILTGRADLVWGGLNPWFAESLANVAATGATDDRPDVELALAEGAAVSVNFTAAPLRDAAGASNGLTLVFQDITRQKRVQSVVTRYMARQFAEQVLAGEVEHDVGSTHVATVLFSDIRRFTSITETLSPQATVEMLNEYFVDMAEVVQRHGGALDKYIGDAVMAVFGVAAARAPDADHAVAAALDMIHALRALNKRRAGRGARPIEIGIGLATGEVAAGPLGAPSRLDYTVIGDTVNLASRLESATKHYGATILVPGSTVERLQARRLLRAVDLIRVKGKERPVEIYEVLDHYTDDMLPRRHEVLPHYEHGVRLYRERNWMAALQRFAKVLETWPKDGPSWTYAERCLYYRDHPPDDTWDGIWTMATK